MFYYDSHTHLDEDRLYQDRKSYLDKFVTIGGKGLVNVGASWQYNENALKISQTLDTDGYKDCLELNAFGLHPLEVVDGHVSILNLLFELKKLSDFIICNRKYLVSIGECGIDLHYANTEEILKVQKELFAGQCDLCQELNLPVMIHSRDGFDHTIDVLKNYKNLDIYFHCRGYGSEQVKRLQSLFPKLWIGFAGNVTYKKANDLRESLKLVDRNQLLLETDAPYLTPQTIRGELNHPANVKYIYDFVSDFLGIEMIELCQLCEENFKGYYRVGY